MSQMQVKKAERGSALEKKLAEYARNCSWAAGAHLASLLTENKMEDWECAFALLDEKEEIIGFCTFLKTDYYPENRYSPWISTMFVDECARGQRLSGLLIEKAIDYARSCGFTRVFIPSDMTGFYEKYGFEPIDHLVNYGGDTDQIFAKNIQ